MNTDGHLTSFFEHYAAVSLGSESEALAALYAPTFIVAAPQGSRAFENDSRFVAWLRQVRDFNVEHGMVALAVGDVRPVQLSPLHTLATVEWRARFTRTGDRQIGFEISYLLERAGDSWKILSYVSRSDQEEEMRKLGLL
jgi:hypothetical protein